VGSFCPVEWSTLAFFSILSEKVIRKLKVLSNDYMRRAQLKYCSQVMVGKRDGIQIPFSCYEGLLTSSCRSQVVGNRLVNLLVQLDLTMIEVFLSAFSFSNFTKFSKFVFSSFRTSSYSNVNILSCLDNQGSL
jgi:hypothetical protein